MEVELKIEAKANLSQEELDELKRTGNLTLHLKNAKVTIDGAI